MALDDTAGSSKRVTSHAIGTVFTEVEPSGLVQIAVMNYTRNNRTTLRVPMGKSLKGKRETLTETLIREVMQEAPDEPTEFGYELLFGSRLVYWEAVQDDENPETELHLKAFFAAKVTAGKLRTFQASEHGDTPEEETLGPLMYIEARELVGRMARYGATVRCHG